MIRITNAQGFPMLSNAEGVAYQMPVQLARELYRQKITTKEALEEFLEAWGAEPEALEKLLADEFSAEALQSGLANLGLTLETLRDLLEERRFFEDAYGKKPVSLVLHPSELGMLGTALAKEGKIEDLPLRPRRDEAARVFLEGYLGLGVQTDAGVIVGGYRA